METNKVKKKREIEDELRHMLETEHNLDQYTLGWRAGYRKALNFVLE